MTKPIVLVLVSLLAAACTTTVSADDEHPVEPDAYATYVAPAICSKNAECDPTGFARDYPDGESACEAELNKLLGTRNGTNPSSCTTRQLKACKSDSAAASCDGTRTPYIASCQGC